MIILVAMDLQNGILFNRRRVAQDALLRSRILEMTRGHRLWMTPYSARQFSSDPCNSIQISADFPESAAADDYYFAEDCPVSAYEDSVCKIIVYRWQRNYPSDVKFDIALSRWQLVSRTEFPGKSHEIITEEVYIK